MTKIGQDVENIIWRNKHELEFADAIKDIKKIIIIQMLKNYSHDYIPLINRYQKTFRDKGQYKYFLNYMCDSCGDYVSVRNTPINYIDKIMCNCKYTFS